MKKHNQEDGRIFGKDNIDINSIKSFWNARARDDASYKSVLLGSDLVENSANIRNERENAIFQKFIDAREKTCLDIGCGIGRWAHNLKNVIKVYHGIDFTSGFINAAKNSFASFPNIRFFCMSVTSADTSMFLDSYDIIIINGVTMYINDEEVVKLFSLCDALTSTDSIIYFQESISILEDRLTLKDFYSKELKTNYNAIYRTSHEYEDYFSKWLPQFEIFSPGELLLDKETGARKETNAKYWFLRKKNLSHKAADKS